MIAARDPYSRFSSEPPQLERMDVAYHPNGIGGEGFYAITFKTMDDSPDNLFVAAVFDRPGQVAVFNVGPLIKGDIRFGHNSWRGDYYEPTLRSMIAAYEEDRDQIMAVAEGGVKP